LPQTNHSTQKNRILAALPQADLDQFFSDLDPVSLSLKQILYPGRCAPRTRSTMAGWRSRTIRQLRALRCVAIGRKNYLFAGSEAGGRRAAAMYSLIESAKFSGLNPQDYLADVLARIADHPARHIAELLPWNWQPADTTRAAA
jgi:hypothetical protein